MKKKADGGRPKHDLLYGLLGCLKSRLFYEKKKTKIPAWSVLSQCNFERDSPSWSYDKWETHNNSLL